MSKSLKTKFLRYFTILKIHKFLSLYNALLKKLYIDSIFKSFSFILLIICIPITSSCFPSSIYTQLVSAQLALMKKILWVF